MTIDRPSREVEAAFAAAVANWMPALVQQADGVGERLLSELGFNVGKNRIQRQIDVTVGSSQRIVGATLIPIRWRSASASSIFPVLEGQLEIAPLGTDNTQLGLSATYEPPLGLVGQIADRALLHRVAEVTVKDFLESVAKRIASIKE